MISLINDNVVIASILQIAFVQICMEINNRKLLESGSISFLDRCLLLILVSTILLMLCYIYTHDYNTLRDIY